MTTGFKLNLFHSYFLEFICKSPHRNQPYMVGSCKGLIYTGHHRFLKGQEPLPDKHLDSTSRQAVIRASRTQSIVSEHLPHTKHDATKISHW